MHPPQPKVNPTSPDTRRRLRRLLTSDDGKLLLACIYSRTLARPTLAAGGGDGHALALFMALREGENTLARWLLALAENPEQARALSDVRIQDLLDARKDVA